MRPFMRFGIVIALLAGGCGKEIGDACILPTDCDPNGTRTCDLTAREGYCTIMGCDYDTCPSEAACIRFFTGEFENRPCDPATEDVPGGTDACTPDELCDLEQHCVSRASEVRYCMRTCGSDGDCRDGYECRDLTLMKEHGGEPVLAPGVPVDDKAPKFCAAKPQTPSM
jgi:hypothetical protein